MESVIETKAGTILEFIQEADEQIQRVGTILTREADLLDEATAALNK